MKTPRTDAFAESFDWFKHSDYDAYVGMKDFASQLETELATARSFLRDASMRADGYMYGMDKARAELAAMTALADRLAEALEKADCAPDCESIYYTEKPCDCGRLEALAAYENHKKQTP